MSHTRISPAAAAEVAPLRPLVRGLKHVAQGTSNVSLDFLLIQRQLEARRTEGDYRCHPEAAQQNVIGEIPTTDTNRASNPDLFPGFAQAAAPSG